MTESPTPNPDMVNLGAVALGAYVLGRMKKGRAAVGLAMWAAGVRADPKQLLRQGLLGLANSAEGRELLTQLRGPLLDAGRKAAGATIEGQMSALTAALTQRTKAITEGPQKAAETAQETVDTATKTASDAGEKAGHVCTASLPNELGEHWYRLGDQFGLETELRKGAGRAGQSGRRPGKLTAARGSDHGRGGGRPQQ